MTTTTNNGVTVFTNSDAYNLAPDVKTAFESANIIYNVTSQAQRDAFTPKYDGLTVRRLDLGGRPLEVWDGTAWGPGSPGIRAYSYDASTSAGFSSGEWFVQSINNVALKAGHKYRVRFRFNHVFTTAASLAFAINLKKSLTTDTGTTGTGLEGGGWTLWSAPVSNSGMTSEVSAFYTPVSDESVRFLVTTGRLTGSSLYDLSAKALSIMDEGYLL